MSSEPSSRFPSNARGWRREIGLVCAGQLVSLLGSALTNAALAFWVLETTHSTTRFALIGFAATIPALLLGPLGGVLIDRIGRRRVLLLADVVAATATAALAARLFDGEPGLATIFVFMFVSSACATVRWPALMAAAATLSPPEQLGRVSAILQGTQAIAYLTAPMLAALMLSHFGLKTIVGCDGATYVVALATLVAARIPDGAAQPRAGDRRSSLAGEMREGWRFLATRPGLVALIAVGTSVNFAIGCVQAVVSPFLLSFTSLAGMGVVYSVGLSGTVVGTVLAGLWRAPLRARATLRWTTAAAIAVAGIALRPSTVWVGGWMFSLFVSVAAAAAVEQALWMASVPSGVQGRVFAIRQMAVFAGQPLAFALAGPLVQYVLEPSLPHYGIPCLLLVVGIAILALTLTLSSSERVQDLDGAAALQPSEVSP